MSSGPVGLDAREYSYACFHYEAPDTLIHSITTQNAWLITRVQVWASESDNTFITLSGSSSIEIAAGGCVTLEPNGAFRGVVNFGGGGGAGARIVIEYWFQAQPSGNPPTVSVTP